MVNKISLNEVDKFPKKTIRKDRLLILLSISILLGITVLILPVKSPKKISEEKANLINELNEIATNKIAKIIILPYGNSSDIFEYVISDQKILNHIAFSLKNADMVGKPSRSFRLFECIIVFYSGDNKYKYQATVNKGNEKYLYIADNPFVQIDDRTSVKTADIDVRVPNVAGLLMKLAPKGIVKRD